MSSQHLFPIWAKDTIRYGDTDRQGHVNNAVFSTFLETGRVALLYDEGRKIITPGTNFVIARLTMDFRAEMFWPGEARIGTGVIRIGRSSLVLRHAIFQNETCVAEAESTMVLVSHATRRSSPLTPEAIAVLETFRMPAAQENA